jgi:predicted 3-demethylubiquinone-9 3-methyltransferase (glyoxalase superfamily)
MPKITPFLWFDGQAEEAARLYVSLFPGSKINAVSRAGDQVMSVSFEIAGQSVVAFNGGPAFRFTEALSLSVDCEDQAEVDRLWSALTANGGRPSRCGWLKDPYGLSWQIVPKAFHRMMSDPDPATAGRVREAMLKMTKFDVAGLERAYAG